MNTKELQELVASELFQSQGYRKTEAANRWPDVEVTGKGVDALVIEGIVEDVLNDLSFTRLRPIIDPREGRTAFARVDPDGTVKYVLVTWIPSRDGSDSVFNPSTDLQIVELPTADRRYIVGQAFGVAPALPAAGLDSAMPGSTTT